MSIMFKNVWIQILMCTCLQIFACIVTSWPDRHLIYSLWTNMYVCSHEGMLFVCYCVKIHKKSICLKNNLCNIIFLINWMHLCWRKVWITPSKQSYYWVLTMLLIWKCIYSNICDWFTNSAWNLIWGKWYISVSQRWGLIQENLHTRGSSEENWGTTRQRYWEVNTSIIPYAGC